VAAFVEDDLLDLSAVMTPDTFCVPEAGKVVVAERRLWVNVNIPASFRKLSPGVPAIRTCRSGC